MRSNRRLLEAVLPGSKSRHTDRATTAIAFFGFLAFSSQRFFSQNKNKAKEEAGAEIFAFGWPLYRYAETTAKRTKTENDL
jgi:hypothetical protein